MILTLTADDAYGNGTRANNKLDTFFHTNLVFMRIREVYHRLLKSTCKLQRCEHRPIS